MLLYQYENILKIIQVFLNYGESEPKIISKFKSSTHKWLSYSSTQSTID